MTYTNETPAYANLQRVEAEFEAASRIYHAIDAGKTPRAKRDAKAALRRAAAEHGRAIRALKRC